MNALRRQRARGSSISKFLFLVTLFAALRVGSCQEWSGFVNALGANFDYICPSDQVITGLASDFR